MVSNGSFFVLVISTMDFHCRFCYFILGISRLTLPSGTKGFGGTEGFMAPEIMRYNGEEEYTEKVCHSGSSQGGKFIVRTIFMRFSICVF